MQAADIPKASRKCGTGCSPVLSVIKDDEDGKQLLLEVRVLFTAEPAYNLPLYLQKALLNPLSFLMS